MSKDTIYNLLRARYPENGYALLEEVSDKAGFDRSRSADYIIMNLWPSRGLALEGIELKSHRNDWLNELKKPEKAENIFQFCDHFWLLTSDESIAKLEEIPSTWGWLCIKGSRIFIKKQAPQLTPKPISRHFLAALLKRAADKTGFIRKSDIEVTIKAAEEKAEMKIPYRTRMIEDKNKELTNIINDYKEASGIDLIEGISWRRYTKEIGKAVKFLEDNGIDEIKKKLIGLETTAKHILKNISEGLRVLPEQNIAINGRICVFCEEICEDAPTERGWSEVLQKNGNRQGLHFDCARKVAHNADLIDKEEQTQTTNQPA